MKPTPSSWLCLLVLILSTGCHTLPAPKLSTVQINLGSLLNTRVITTQSHGQLQLADHSLDRGDSSVLITKSAMEVAYSGQLNPLPDSGYFPANTDHPDVQLPYGTADAGPQVHQSVAKTETYSLPVPANHYAQLQLFFISAAGPSPISIRLKYADGSTAQRTTQVTDFYYLPKPPDTNWFVLAEDFGKVNLKARMTESVHHYIHGYNLNPDATKKLQQIEITKENSSSVLNLFGATGTILAP
ncbi:MAG TPA: hypothetical protein VG347_20865 [Verrucomicrobiae bacterium]|nr:hypothetical protein [Verrucomicrobiae bacterium]